MQNSLADFWVYWSCFHSARYHKDISILLRDLEAELQNALGSMLDENSEPPLCKLEDGEVYIDGWRMLMWQADPLMKRVNEIIDLGFEAGLFIYWISREINSYKLLSFKTPIGQRLDGYYSFNPYHMQPAFYLLLMCWCLSAFCFMVELLYSRLLSIIV